MSALELAARHYRQRQRLGKAVEVAGARAWRQVDTSNIAASWSVLSPRVIAALIAAQIAAAGLADGYTTSVLAELGVDVDPAGQVVPRSLSGLSADGRDLTGLMLSPLVIARSGLARGQSLTQAMSSGQAALRLMLRTEVADASRVADGVAVAARPTVGWVRMVNPPSCPRCAILAGRTYRYSQGFQRHPGCDCTMIPAPESLGNDLRTDPRQLFDQGQIRGLSKADSRAITDGADMNRVVNAQRGMHTADVGRRFGRVKATHALAGRQGIPSLRLRPETIYRDATSRADSVRLLKLHGYIR